MKLFFMNAVVAFLSTAIMAGCDKSVKEPVSQDWTLVYTASITNELEPCG